MDLKMRDVSQLLNVSVSTIRRWLAEGKIPAYRLGNQYRFSPMEIEAWVLKRRVGDIPPLEMKPELDLSEDLEEEALPSQGSHHFSLYRAIHNGSVLSGIEGASKEEVIENVIKEIAPPLGLDPEVMTELLLERERMMPTALDKGLAAPHTRELLLDGRQDIVTVVFLEEPIDYGALDGEPVHTLFFLFAADDKRHLHLLAKIAHLASDKEALQLLKARPNKMKFLRFIKSWESSLNSSHPQ